MTGHYAVTWTPWATDERTRTGFGSGLNSRLKIGRKHGIGERATDGGESGEGGEGSRESIVASTVMRSKRVKLAQKGLGRRS